VKLGIFGFFAKFYRQRWAKLGIFGIFCQFLPTALGETWHFWRFCQVFLGRPVGEGREHGQSSNPLMSE
jgi:hypothetical protein